MIWFLVVLYIILGVFITLGNFTVILVYLNKKKIKHSQDIFRLFLGVADIIVGLIVLPTAVNTMLKMYQHTLQLQSPIDIIRQERFLSTNGSYSYKITALTTNMFETIAMAENRFFPLVYKNSIGFFKNTSLTASIYLLTVSGIDRLRALLKPLHYNQNVAKRFAILGAIICWILAIFFSVLPIFVNGLSYKTSVGGFVLLSGEMSPTLYLIEIIIPLIAAWIITVLLYRISQKTFDRSRNLSFNEVEVKYHRQLSFLLLLVVAAFSMSLLPAALFVLLSFFISGTSPESQQTYNSTNSNVANALKLTVILFVESNSLWNFLIYSFRIKTFRKVALEKYQKIWNLINCSKSLFI